MALRAEDGGSPEQVIRLSRARAQGGDGLRGLGSILEKSQLGAELPRPLRWHVPSCP